MSALPRDPQVDSALALFKDGYEFISRRCRRWGTDAFAARLLTNDVVCMTGPGAAREFSDAAQGVFRDRAVLPPAMGARFVEKLIQGDIG